MAIRVAINGFGRIGRLVMRAAYEHRPARSRSSASTISGSVATNAHLLRYDSVHGRFPGEVTTGDNWMDVGRGKIRVTAERDPAKLPWKELDVDVALECTGIFTKREAAAKHLEAGAKKVIISAPADGADFTVVMGVNHDELKPEHQVISNALVHDQLPGAGRLCAAPGDRHRARLHDDDPRLYRRPEPAGHAAQRSAPGARRGAVADPDLDRRGAGGRPRPAGAEGQARRHRDPRADPERVADRLQVRRGARDHRRRGQFADGGGGEVEPAQGHPRHQQGADRVGRFQPRLAQLDLRRDPDPGARQDASCASCRGTTTNGASRTAWSRSPPMFGAMH